jgi:hypothetical protein
MIIACVVVVVIVTEIAAMTATTVGFVLQIDRRVILCVLRMQMIMSSRSCVMYWIDVMWMDGTDVTVGSGC